MHSILNLSLKNSSFYFFASVIDFVIFLKVLVIVSCCVEQLAGWGISSGNCFSENVGLNTYEHVVEDEWKKHLFFKVLKECYSINELVEEISITKI